MKKQPPVQFDIGLNVNHQGKPALDCQFVLPKVLGTSASIATELSVSSLIAHSFNLKYSLPFSTWTFAAEAVKQVNDMQAASSFAEHVSGMTVSWSKGGHRIGIDAHLRDIHPLVGIANKFAASEQVRRSPLRTIKTGVSYKYVLDKQVMKAAAIPHPVGGYKLCFFSDFCGLFGDVRFAKLESSFQTHRRIIANQVVLHSRIGAGAIAQLNVGRGAQTPIQDRFFLGGSIEERSCLRAFAARGVGPVGKRISNPGNASAAIYDHLGGDVYVSFDNVVSFPLYHAKDGPDIRGMIFAQTGSLIPTLHSKALQDLRSNVKCCIGAGILVPIGAIGTMEITVGKPVLGTASVTDTQQILQIGIRLSSREY